MNWFECKVSYEKMIEGGRQKKATEPYLVDAMSFTEAEARIIEELTPYISGEFMVADIRRVRLAELFYNEQGDRFYKAKVCYISLDEKSGVEKRTVVQMLAQASSVREALDRIDEGMKGSMADYEVAAITESPLVDVFPFSEGAKARQGEAPTAKEGEA